VVNVASFRGKTCTFVQPRHANSESSTEIQRFPRFPQSKVENRWANQRYGGPLSATLERIRAMTAFIQRFGTRTKSPKQ